MRAPRRPKPAGAASTEATSTGAASTEATTEKAATAGGSTQRARRHLGPATGRGHTRRSELLAAARRVFERRGFLEARVADIVAEARVAQGTFYTYFEDKEQIFAEVARSAVDEVLAALRADPQQTDPYEVIVAANRRFIAAYRPNARIIALIEQVGTFTPAMRELRLALRDTLVERSARGIRRFQEEGIADPRVDARLVAEVLGSMVDQTCYVWLTLGREFDEAELIRTMTDVWTRAVGIPGPARP